MLHYSEVVSWCVAFRETQEKGKQESKERETQEQEEAGRAESAPKTGLISNIKTWYRGQQKEKIAKAISYKKEYTPFNWVVKKVDLHTLTPHFIEVFFGDSGERGERTTGTERETGKRETRKGGHRQEREKLGRKEIEWQEKYEKETEEEGGDGNTWERRKKRQEPE